MSNGIKNTVGDFLRSVFSTLVNKDDVIFKALFANPEETGAVETIFNTLETVRNKWCNNSNIYEQDGEMLEKSMSYFSILERLFAESDESFKGRNELLYYRNGDTIWGDKWDILGIFKSYFNTDLVFIVNDTNSIEENLFLDGDFEEKNAWTLEDCTYDEAACFSERLGILFDSPGTCKQSVNVDADSTYFIHYFLNGNIGVQVKDNNGRYWDAARGEFGEWVNTAVVNNATSNTWDAKHLFFLTDGNVNKVTVSFIGGTGIAMLDYVRLFKKYAYSSFTLIADFIGRYTSDTLAMAPGKDDPVKRKDYSIFGHFSDGKHDSDTTDPDNLSFVETAALNEDKSPLMAAGKDDRDNADIKPANDMYIEQKPLAPGEGDDDDGVDVDYSKMSYIEQANLYGTDTIRPESVYSELLEIVRAGGITSYIEILTRNLEE